MNTPIIKPEWIPSAYTDADKKEQAETSNVNRPKLRLLKHSPKTSRRGPLSKPHLNGVALMNTLKNKRK
jgi:hypothetical protein